MLYKDIHQYPYANIVSSIEIYNDIFNQINDPMQKDVELLAKVHLEISIAQSLSSIDETLKDIHAAICALGK